MRRADRRHLLANNFAYAAESGELADNLIRITALAHFDRWQLLAEDAYRVEKLRWYDRLAASAVEISGFGLPFRTATATATVASGVSLLERTWPEARTSGYGG